MVVCLVRHELQRHLLTTRELRADGEHLVVADRGQVAEHVAHLWLEDELLPCRDLPLGHLHFESVARGGAHSLVGAAALCGHPTGSDSRCGLKLGLFACRPSRLAGALLGGDFLCVLLARLLVRLLGFLARALAALRILALLALLTLVNRRLEDVECLRQHAALSVGIAWSHMEALRTVGQ